MMVIDKKVKRMKIKLYNSNTIYPKPLAGFSVLELITVITIIGLMFGIAIPNYHKFLMREERSLALHRLATAIDFAKQEAITRGKIVVVCSSVDGKTCSSSHNWTNGYIVGIERKKSDKDKIQSLNGETAVFEVLQVFSGIRFGYLHFNQFGKQHLHLQPNGMTDNNGTFTYCPKNGDAKEADGLIINHAARSYRPKERNVLGVLLKKEGTEDAEPLVCQ